MLQYEEVQPKVFPSKMNGKKGESFIRRSVYVSDNEKAIGCVSCAFVRS